MKRKEKEEEKKEAPKEYNKILCKQSSKKFPRLVEKNKNKTKQTKMKNEKIKRKTGKRRRDDHIIMNVFSFYCFFWN